MLRYLLVLSVLCSLHRLEAQLYKMMMEDPSYNVYDVQAEADRYFAGKDQGKGSGYNPYKRWLYKNESLFAPSGDRSRFDSKSIYVAYDNIKKQSEHSRFITSVWRDLGPYAIDSITGHYAPGLGRVECVWVDKNNPNKIYLSSRSGGLWKTLNGGATWQNMTDGLPVTGVNTFDVNPLNSNDILINIQGALNGVSHGIYRSLDGGLTWNVTTFNPSNTSLGGFGSNFSVAEVRFHPMRNDTIYIACSDGLYRSVNNLTNVTKIMSGGMGQVVFHPTNVNVIYMSYDYYWDRNRLLKSTNGGNTFTEIQSFTANNYAYPTIATTKANDNVVYFASSAGIWKSTDQGSTFTLYSTNGAPFGVSDILENQVITGSIDAWRNNNVTDANTWVKCSDWYLPPPTTAFPTDYVHADLRYIYCLNGIFYVGTDGFLVKSADGGVTWTIISNSVGIRENYCLGVSQSNKDVASFGSQDNGSSLLGRNKQWVEWYGADGMEQIVHPDNADYIMGNIQNGGKRRSKNGTLTNENVPNPSGVTFDWIAPLAYSPTNFNTVYAAGNSLCISKNFGTSFSTLYSFPANVKEMAIAENNSNIIIASIGSTLYKSTNAGVTFTTIGAGLLPSHTITDIAFDPKDDQTFVLVYGQYNNNNARVYITRNGGTTWQNISYNLSAIPAYSVVIDHTPQKNLYIGTETGVFIKSMAATSYAVFGTGMPPVGVNEMEIQYATNTLKVATWGRGHWETDLQDRASYVDINDVTFTANIAEGLTIGQSVYALAKVSAGNKVAKSFMRLSTNDLTLNQEMEMYRVNDSLYISASPLQAIGANDSTYFKIFAVSTTNDTTDTYRYMFKSRSKPAYCTAAGTSGTTSDYINRVKVGTTENVSGKTTYSNFTNIVMPINNYSALPIYVKLEFAFTEDKAQAWVDWDNSGIFDNNEKISFSTYVSNEAQGTVVVPHGINDGDYIMRVRSGFNSPNAGPCGSVAGEVEDYTIRVIGSCNPNPMVTNTNNAYVGSLRSELYNACPADTIYFDSSLIGDTLKVYNPLIVAKQITITGDSGFPFVFSGRNANIIFEISKNLNLMNVHLINGNGNPSGGGALINNSLLTLRNVSFNNNYEGTIPKAMTNYGSIIVNEGVSEIKN